MSDETTKPMLAASTRRANRQAGPGGSGQDDPGLKNDDLTQNTGSESHKSTDQRIESSPSCGWKGVCYHMGVAPGR